MAADVYCSLKFIAVANSSATSRSGNINGKKQPGLNPWVPLSIALAFLVLAIWLSATNKDQIDVIVYLLVSFALGLLSSLMIGKIETQDISIFQIKIKQISGGFLVFALCMSVFIFYKKASSQAQIDSLNNQLKNAVQISDPRQMELWNGVAGVFEWYNPPLALATDEHQKMKVDWFTHQGFELRVVLFHSPDAAQNSRHLKPRLENLKKFVTALRSSHPTEFDKHITVKIVDEPLIPTMAFFTTLKWGKNQEQHSIIYLPTRSEIMKPERCLHSSAPELNRMLHVEFESAWRDGTLISLDRLLGANVNNNFDITTLYDTN